MDPLLSETTTVVLYIFSIIFGTVVGSFLNVCIYRFPREESIVFPSSHCPVCKYPVGARHNIPVISFLLLGGKCRNCGSRISYIYPVVEILSGLLTFMLVLIYGIQFKTAVYMLVTYSLIVISLIDLRYMIIPNVITIPGIFAGLAVGAIRTDWHSMLGELSVAGAGDIVYMISRFPVIDSLAGMIFGGGILLSIAYLYKLLRKIEGMGMGDVKLLAMLGTFLGVQGVIFIIFLSSLLGSVSGISLVIYNRGDLKYAIPYGPFISLAAITYMLYDNIFILFR